MRIVFPALAIIAVILVPSVPLNAAPGAIVDPAVVTPIPGADTVEGKRTIEKMTSIIIPKVIFEKFDIADVVDFLKVKSQQLDPDHLGVKFRLALPPGPGSKSPHFHREVTILLDNVPIQDLLAYVCQQTNLSYSIVDGVVVLAPVDAAADSAPPHPQ